MWAGQDVQVCSLGHSRMHILDCMEIGETRDLGRPPESIANNSNRSGRGGYNYQGIRGRGGYRGNRGRGGKSRGGSNNQTNGQSNNQSVTQNGGEGTNQPRFYNHGNRPARHSTRNGRDESTSQIIGYRSENGNQKSKKRILCAPPAPPEGLYLARVIY